MPPKIEERRTKLMELAIPAITSVIVALITATVAIMSGSKSLGSAAEAARDATTEARALNERLSGAAMPVGSVVGSLLSAGEFAVAAQDLTVFDPAKSKWALADGREVVGSAFASVAGRKRLPDLRGLFLRGVNAGRTDEWRDPAADRDPGAPQRWSTGPPQSPLLATTAGGHVHPAGQGPSSGYVGRGAGQHQSGPHAGPAYGAEPMGPAGDHTHVMSGGDAETRPSNAAVYYFVRINP